MDKLEEFQKNIPKNGNDDFSGCAGLLALLGVVVASHAANMIGGMYKGIINSQGNNLDSNYYLYFLTANTLSTESFGLFSENLKHKVYNSIAAGATGALLSLAEFGIGYGMGYVGGKIFL